MYSFLTRQYKLWYSKVHIKLNLSECLSKSILINRPPPPQKKKTVAFNNMNRALRIENPAHEYYKSNLPTGSLNRRFIHLMISFHCGSILIKGLGLWFGLAHRFDSVHVQSRHWYHSSIGNEGNALLICLTKLRTLTTLM